VQVVDDQCRQAIGTGIEQQGLERGEQGRAAGRARCSDDGLANFRQHPRQLVSLRRFEHGRDALDHGPQRPAEAGIGHAGIARPRRDEEDLCRGLPGRGLGRELRNQPRLAQAGLAEQPEGALSGPGGSERGLLARPADQARRAQQAGRDVAPRDGLRHRRGADRLPQRAGALCRHCVQRLGEGGGEAVVDGQRRRPFAL
jgi:hypothetical protein